MGIREELERVRRTRLAAGECRWRAELSMDLAARGMGPRQALRLGGTEHNAPVAEYAPVYGYWRDRAGELSRRADRLFEDRARPALHALTPGARRCVELYFNRACDWDEVADRTGLTEAACRRACAGALRELERIGGSGRAEG